MTNVRMIETRDVRFSHSDFASESAGVEVAGGGDEDAEGGVYGGERDAAGAGGGPADLQRAAAEGRVPGVDVVVVLSDVGAAGEFGVGIGEGDVFAVALVVVGIPDFVVAGHRAEVAA